MLLSLKLCHYLSAVPGRLAPSALTPQRRAVSRASLHVVAKGKVHGFQWESNSGLPARSRSLFYIILIQYDHRIPFSFNYNNCIYIKSPHFSLDMKCSATTGCNLVKNELATEEIVSDKKGWNLERQLGFYKVLPSIYLKAPAEQLRS